MFINVFNKFCEHEHLKMDAKIEKSIIRSILISTKRNTTLSQLNNDYVLLEGHSIPFEKFGYKQLEPFLRSLKDTVEIIGCGPHALVKAIDNSKSKHVSDMVKIQNPSKSRALNAYRKRSRKNVRNSIARNPTNSKTGGRYRAPTYKTCIKHFNSMEKITEEFSNLNINQTKESYTTKTEKKIDNEVVLNTRISEQSKSTQGSEKVANDEIMPALNGSWKGHKLIKMYQNNKQFSKNPIEVPLDVDSSLLKLFSRKRDNEVAFKRKPSNEEAVPLYAANATAFLITIPEEVMHYEDKILPAPIPEEILTAPFINVYLTEVYSPFQFWFYYPHKSQPISGYALMSNLAKFYKPLERSRSYIIPRVLIKPGFFCAAQYNNVWHRAEILTHVDSHDIVKVFYVDFGTVDEIEYHKIMYLHKDFGVYPALVIRGCLSDVDPNGPHWSIHATAFFLEKVTSKMLQAVVSDIDQVKRIVYLTLYNNASTEDITDKLVKANLANYNDEWTLDNGEHRYHTREEFPTFDMIEKGLYPNIKQISAALYSGQNLESYYDTIFYNQEYLEKLRTNPFNPFYCEILEDILKMPSN